MVQRYSSGSATAYGKILNTSSLYITVVILRVKGKVGKLTIDSEEVTVTVLHHFDRKFTNSENLLAEMADKFSFEF
jgi:hypothetical protein